MVSDEELKIIGGETLADQREPDVVISAAKERSNVFPFFGMLNSSSLWLMSFVQFASNFGWAFLVTLMPRYLKEVHQVSQQAQGWMLSVPLAAGIVGLLVGGVLTDFFTRRLVCAMDAQCC